MSKAFSLFINFDGECREAVAYYAKVFQSKVTDLMAYSEMPPDPDYTMPEADKDRVMYANVPIFGVNIMFCDNPSGMPLVKGNNISPTLITDDADEIRRIYGEMLEGGESLMELQKTFWSGLYGMVQDKYGVIWQLSLDDGQETA